MNFAQNSKKEFRVYENDEFVFHYPKSWYINNYKQIKKRKDEVMSLMNKVTEIPKYNGVPFNSFCIIVETFDEESLAEYINKINDPIRPVSGMKGAYTNNSFSKIDDNHYTSIDAVGSKTNIKGVIFPNSFIHYMLHNSKLYILRLSYLPGETSKILNDAGVIFNSFKFKN